MLLLNQMWYSSIDQVVGEGLPRCHQNTVTNAFFSAQAVQELNQLKRYLSGSRHDHIVAKHRLYDKPDHIRICKACAAVASEDTWRIMWRCLWAFDALADSKH